MPDRAHPELRGSRKCETARDGHRGARGAPAVRRGGRFALCAGGPQRRLQGPAGSGPEKRQAVLDPAPRVGRAHRPRERDDVLVAERREADQRAHAAI